MRRPGGPGGRPAPRAGRDPLRDWAVLAVGLVLVAVSWALTGTAARGLHRAREATAARPCHTRACHTPPGAAPVLSVAGARAAPAARAGLGLAAVAAAGGMCAAVLAGRRVVAVRPPRP